MEWEDKHPDFVVFLRSHLPTNPLRSVPGGHRAAQRRAKSFAWFWQKEKCRVGLGGALANIKVTKCMFSLIWGLLTL